MVFWETIDAVNEQTSVMGDYAAIWQAADKIVYSRTLTRPSSARTQIEPEFDPNAIRRLKVSSERDISVGGPGLAAHAIRDGLVDEWHQFLTPVVVGGGTYWLPDHVAVTLELLDEHRFANGTVHLHYRTTTP